MKKIFILVLLLLSTVIVEASPPSRIFSYNSGEVIDPSKVTQNEDAIFNYLTRGVDTFSAQLTTDNILNGTIENADISGTAGITYGKLSFSNNIVASDIASTTVTSGSYTNTDLTVDADGRITSASSGVVDLTSEVSGILVVANGGTGSSSAANAVNGVAVLDASGYLPASSVPTTALKTATGEVSTTTAAYDNLTLPGGEYGFYPQIKGTGGNVDVAIAVTVNPGGTYITFLNMKTTTGTVYARQRYVTASGEDLWVFLLVDKTTQKIISAYQAPDHPAYGNGGDFEKVDSPFKNYDTETQEVVLLDKETCLALKAESKDTGKSILTLINEDYKIGSEEKTYIPLHSGKFLDEDGKQVKQMVNTIPDYIKVRKLVKK